MSMLGKIVDDIQVFAEMGCKGQRMREGTEVIYTI